MRRADTDAGAVANFIDPIECIDDIDANRQRLATIKMKRMTGAKVDLRIGRQVSAVRNILAIRQWKIGTQAAAEQ